LQAQEKCEGRISKVARVVRLGNCRLNAAVKPALAQKTHQNDQIIIDSECFERLRLLIQSLSFWMRLSWRLFCFISFPRSCAGAGFQFCVLRAECAPEPASRESEYSRSLFPYTSHTHRIKEDQQHQQQRAVQAVLHLHVVITIFENFPMGCAYQRTIGSSK